MLHCILIGPYKGIRNFVHGCDELPSGQGYKKIEAVYISMIFVPLDWCV